MNRGAWRATVHKVAKNQTQLSCLVKAMVFHVVMYGCESWTVKIPFRWSIFQVFIVFVTMFLFYVFWGVVATRYVGS